MMKKYGMLILTLFVITITFCIYYYENSNIPNISYQYPEINFQSEKYGLIRNIQWSSQSDDHILFLAIRNDEETNKEISKLYAMDIDTGEVKEVIEFLTHPILKDYMQYQPWGCGDILYTASPEGIYGIRMNQEMENIHEDDFYQVPCFEDVNNCYILHKIYFNKYNDNLLYIYNFPQSSLNFFNTNVKQIQPNTCFKKPYTLVLRTLLEHLYYTKKEKDSIHLYDLHEGRSIMKDKHIARDIISAKTDLWGYDLLGYINKGEEYAIYWVNDVCHEPELCINDHILGTIPKNKDLLGQLPDVQAACGEDIIAYTSYNEDHLGTLFWKRNDGKNIEIVKEAPIVGPLRLSIAGEKILFFTLEGEDLHVHIYDLLTDKVEDLTDTLR